MPTPKKTFDNSASPKICGTYCLKSKIAVIAPLQIRIDPSQEYFLFLLPEAVLSFSGTNSITQYLP